MFDDTIPDDRVVEAVREVSLGGWLDGHADGVHTVLTDGARGMSAGEAQLLAFARVLVTDPGLVVLDEASSRLGAADRTMSRRPQPARRGVRIILTVYARRGSASRERTHGRRRAGRAREERECPKSSSTARRGGSRAAPPSFPAPRYRRFRSGPRPCLPVPTGGFRTRRALMRPAACVLYWGGPVRGPPRAPRADMTAPGRSTMVRAPG